VELLALPREDPLDRDLVERAEDGPHREERIDVRAHETLALGFLDLRLEGVEVLPELLGAVVAEELVRLAQLDLEDLREIGVSGELAEVMLRVGPHPRDGVVDTFPGRLEALDLPAHLLFEEREEEILLVLEV